MAKKNMSSAFTALCMTLAVAMLCSSLYQGEAAASCDPSGLTSCLSAFTSSGPPSGQCCANLKRQTPSCLCSYKSNPAFGSYVNNPNARRVLKACKVTYPKC